jgi:hypothetical protein
MRRVMTRRGFGEFEFREVCPQAVVNSAAEAQQGRRVPAGDVEAFGVVIHGGVMVGGGDVGQRSHAGRNVDSSDVDVFGGQAQGGENDWAVAHELVDTSRVQLVQEAARHSRR